jgi:hypothetical protein
MAVTTQQITGSAQRVQIELGEHITNVSVAVRGTFTGVNLGFFGSLDGTTWFPTEAVRSAGNVVETTTGVIATAIGTTYSWDVAVGGYRFLSVLSSAYTTGPATIMFSAYSGGVEAAPVVQSHAVTLASTVLAAGTALAHDTGQQYRANATGAASKLHLVSAATTNATVVKASQGRLLGWTITNTNAAARKVAFHNLATTPTAGAAVFMAVMVPPNGIAQVALEGGIGFSAGIGITTVTEAADTGVTAVGQGDLVIGLFFA